MQHKVVLYSVWCVFVQIKNVELVLYELLQRQLQREISVSAEHLFVEQLPVTLTSCSHVWKQMLGSEILHPLKKEQLMHSQSFYYSSYSLMAPRCCTFMIEFLRFTVG